jgi:prepilin-type N-terminal cleavage/methylation domain-containing protein
MTMNARVTRQDGFTLVELVTVMAIMAILLSIATANFNRYTVKTNIEKEVQTIYSTLMTVRLEAFTCKTTRTVTLGNKQFYVYSSAVITPRPIMSVALGYPVVMNVTPNVTPGQVTFDSGGLLVDSNGVPLTTDITICVDPTGNLGSNPGNTDSVEISTAKIYMGKRNGGACVPTITQK